MQPNPLLEKLGYPPDARLVIFHADDVGMCHGSNQAFDELSAAGIVKTGSVMVPCAWSPETFAQARANPLLDLGVHLTLNSEWNHYRWGPISTRDLASGLIDEEGHFWHRLPALLEHMDVAAAQAELVAQIERVAAASVDFTHIDTHMGAAMTAPLVQSYVELGFEYRVPVLLPRRVDDYLRGLGMTPVDEQVWLAWAAAIEERGMPLVDYFRITPGYDTQAEGGRAELYERILADLPAGVTYFSLHPNAPGDIDVITPERAHWRTFEYMYFRSQRLHDFLAAQSIVPIGYREIRDVMRASSLP
jgi:predicted glycoside hydrolase/deacetylase ChbG (UPF0249 family)